MGIFRKRTMKPVLVEPSAPRAVHVSVWGKGDLAADQVWAASLIAEPTQTAFPWSLLRENRLSFDLPTNVPYGWGALLTIQAHGYDTLRQRVFLAPDLNVQLAETPKPLPRITPDGAVFSTSGGAFTAIECSDFRLYQRFLDGHDLGPVLSQRAVVGFNMVRVFGMYNGSLGRFVPRDYRDYYTDLAAFCALAARYGLYVEFVANADSRTVFTSAQDQSAHWVRLVDALTPLTNVLVEMTNEGDQTINQMWADLPRPVQLFAAHGSNGSQALPIQPPWSYQTMHFNDAPEWPRKVGHNAMEIWSGPTLANENTRFPDKCSRPELAYDAAAGAALLCAGSCFHSVRGKTSDLWDGLELICAQEWVAGASSVPLLFQHGQYRHRQELETTDLLRVYSRRLADGREHVVTIRR